MSKRRSQTRNHTRNQRATSIQAQQQHDSENVRMQMFQNQSKEVQKQFVEKQRIEFDAKTGKKISQTKETYKQSETKEENTTTQTWEIHREQRKVQLTLLKQLSEPMCKIKSEFVKPFEDQVIETIRYFERCRLKLGLNYDEKSPHYVFHSAEMASCFCFGVQCDLLTDLVSEEIVDSSCLACLWTWSEMVEFGKRPSFVDNCLKKMSFYTSKEEYEECRTQPCFLVTEKMVSQWIFGCLLANHIPVLRERFRSCLSQNVTNPYNFPSFRRLHIPCSLYDPTTAIFNYDFTLQIPALQIPDCCASFAQTSGEVAISIDGPLVRLIEKQNPSLATVINESFEARALEHPPLDFTVPLEECLLE